MRSLNTPTPIIVWFRADLRLDDNPALHAAVQTGMSVIPLFILDDAAAGEWALGSASRVWLHHSLTVLNAALDGRMIFARGDSLTVLQKLIKETGAAGVYWNRRYEPYGITQDKTIKATLTAAGLNVHSFNANLMYEPWDVAKSDGTPYKVFTPFWTKGCAAKGPPPEPLPSPGKIPTLSQEQYQAFGLDPKVPLQSGPPGQAQGPIVVSLDDLHLLPASPRWDIEMMAHWTPGAAGAQTRFNDFIAHGLVGYKEGRNVPSAPHVSRLSPHLHFGEISPRALYHTVVHLMATGECPQADGTHFLSELGWREFAHHLLYHFPVLPREPLQKNFVRFPWAKDDKAAIQHWQRGQTGYPIVDAGMRELWATGYMHNRVRMIVGSFLVKNMLTHWHVGEDWFWDCLVDADLANNAASWQWIAGCGADAAPYYRIFNPVLQGEKFDPDGTYVRQWVPEIAALPNDYIHHPWDAPPLVMAAAKVTLGKTYPKPMMDHGKARERALAALSQVKIQ